jgi:hypothetical protein
VRAARRRAVLTPALELERRRPADDFQARNLGKQIDDFLRHAVGEVLLILFLAHVGERENRDVLRRDRRRGRDAR